MPRWSKQSSAPVPSTDLREIVLRATWPDGIVVDDYARVINLLGSITIAGLAGHQAAAPSHQTSQGAPRPSRMSGGVQLRTYQALMSGPKKFRELLEATGAAKATMVRTLGVLKAKRVSGPSAGSPDNSEAVYALGEQRTEPKKETTSPPRRKGTPKLRAVRGSGKSKAAILREELLRGPRSMEHLVELAGGAPGGTKATVYSLGVTRTADGLFELKEAKAS